MGRIRTFIVSWYRRGRQSLFQIRDTPHAIAGGVAIGIFFGFTPLWGLKTLLAILVAWLFRFSKISAVLAVTFHDILLPLVPVILRWQYDVGFFIISHPHRLPPRLSPKHLHFDLMSLLTVKTLHLLWPILVGSVFLGIPVAIIMYFVFLEIVTRAQAARARHAARG